MRLSVAGIILCVLATSASAGIAATGANVTVLSGATLDTTIAADNNSGTTTAFESDTNIFVWYETTQSVTAAQAAANPYEHDGTNAIVYNGAALTGTLSTTTAYNWYLVHIEQASDSGTNVLTSATGGVLSITFDRAIQGVFWRAPALNGTEFTGVNSCNIQRPGSTYSFGVGGRNFNTQVSPFGDYFEISNSRLTFTVMRSTTDSVGDIFEQIRIVTNPEPGSLALFGLGAFGFASVARRRRRLRNSRAAK